ncbi:MAG: hypothetical protein WC374_09160 [Phycisphaerae bacterium]|jgi:hypothetical protein
MSKILKKYKVFGIDRESGKERYRTVKGKTPDEAIVKANNQGIVAEVSRVEEVFEPATERQINLANDLGLNFPENISKYDISSLLDEALSQKKYQKIMKRLPPTEAQIETAQNVADELGIKVPKGLTRIKMSKFLDRIMDIYYEEKSLDS